MAVRKEMLTTGKTDFLQRETEHEYTCPLYTN